MHQVQEQCRDIPTQVMNMIESAKLFLQSLGINVDEKIVVEGYSAGSKFANCFTAIHPEIVKACICGGNSGLGILPITEYKGQQLNYPLGVADIPYFDYDTFCQIPQLYYIGTEDYNDPAMPKTTYKVDSDGNYMLDTNGNRIPQTNEKGMIVPLLDETGKMQPRYAENYTQNEFEIIQQLLGENPQTRFTNNEEVYLSLGINATFQRFPGYHNSVTQNHDGTHYYTNEIVKNFIKSILNRTENLENSGNLNM